MNKYLRSKVRKHAPSEHFAQSLQRGARDSTVVLVMRFDDADQKLDSALLHDVVDAILVRQAAEKVQKRKSKLTQVLEKTSCKTILTR